MAAAVGALRARRIPAEDLAWLGLVPATFILFAALTWLAPEIFELYPDQTYPFYTELYFYAGYEPLEATRFLMAIAVPLLLATAVLGLGARRPRRSGLDVPVIYAQLVVIGFLVWTVLKQREIFPFGFDKLLLPEGNLIAAPVIGAALTAAALGWEGRLTSRARELVKGFAAHGWIALAVAVVATAVWLLPGIYTDATIGTGGGIAAGHVPFQFDELEAAVNGRTPLVDYVPSYSALLPIVLSPIFPLFDNSITSFTVVMSLLSLLALIAVFGAFVQLTERPWTALALYVPFVATALHPWSTVLQPWSHQGVMESNANYYPVMPERYLGPLVVVWLLSRRLRRGSPPLWALYLVAGIGLFVNVEFGAPCLIALTAALLLGADRDRPLGPRLRERATQAALGLLGAFALVTALILVRSGELPEFSLLIYFARLVARGYSLAPMPPWGFHWVLYVTYVAALLIAVVRSVNRSPDRTLTGMLAFAGIFGLATAGYFGGRSLQWQLWGLFPAWGLTVAALARVAWLSLRSAATDRGRLRRVALGSFAVLSGFGLMVASLDRMPAPWEQIDRIPAAGQAKYDDRDVQGFIEDRTSAGDKVLIFGPNLEHRLAERAGVEDVSPWYGTIGLASPNETNRAIEQLEDAGGTRVFVTFRQQYQFISLLALEQLVARALHAHGFEPVLWNRASDTVEWQPVEGG